MRKRQKTILVLAMTALFISLGLLYVLISKSDLGSSMRLASTAICTQEDSCKLLKDNTRAASAVLTEYSPRFTDNGDGTVTDNLTGLIWLKNADRFGRKNWSEALSHCNDLADDEVNLADGSHAGDWRIPSLEELQSLIHGGFCDPAVPNTSGKGKWFEGDPFTNLKTYYWSATGSEDNKRGWVVNMSIGSVPYGHEAYAYHVWPVRGSYSKQGSIEG